jgi:5-(carboxyamino)imidazole ribonucleotide synthase
MPFQFVETRSDLNDLVHPFPFCLKSTSGGYDGKGVKLIYTKDDLSEVFDGPYLVEDMAKIYQEIAVIVVRGVNGSIECYDPVTLIMSKETQSLDFLISPAQISIELQLEAINLAIDIAQKLEIVGLLAVEMFITDDGKLFVNELSPRPHNSGHHTLNAASVSQFEQHLRAVMGWPIGDCKSHSAAIMVNIYEPLAENKVHLPDRLRKLLQYNDVHLHWYGKDGGHPGRKMGHVTITDKSIENILSKAALVRYALKFN